MRHRILADLEALVEECLIPGGVREDLVALWGRGTYLMIPYDPARTVASAGRVRRLLEELPRELSRGPVGGCAVLASFDSRGECWGAFAQAEVLLSLANALGMARETMSPGAAADIPPPHRPVLLDPSADAAPRPRGLTQDEIEDLRLSRAREFEEVMHARAATGTVQ